MFLVVAYQKRRQVVSHIHHPGGYLQAKQHYLDQKTLSERQNVDCVLKFGYFTISCWLLSLLMGEDGRRTQERPANAQDAEDAHVCGRD